MGRREEEVPPTPTTRWVSSRACPTPAPTPCSSRKEVRAAPVIELGEEGGE